ncbi:hypothetical protein EDD21DRAFT_389732 [Dissophora ornata]|nr:hypothetical protein EDD21DRAFT_389732 [Dissophora ornata]
MEQNNAPSTSTPPANHGTATPQQGVARHEELIHGLREKLYAIVGNRYDKLGNDLDAVVQGFRSNMDEDVHVLITDYLRIKTELMQLQEAYNRLQNEKAVQSPFQPTLSSFPHPSLTGTDSLQHSMEVQELHRQLQLQQHIIQQLQGEFQITGSELHRAMEDVQNLKNANHELVTRLRSYDSERVGLHQTIANKTAVNNQIATILEHRQREINENKLQLDTLCQEVHKLRAFITKHAQDLAPIIARRAAAAAANIAQTAEAAREDSLHAHVSGPLPLAPAPVLGPGPTSSHASWPANTTGPGSVSPPGSGSIPNSASWPVQTVGSGSVLPPLGPPMALWPSQKPLPVIDHAAKEGALQNDPERSQPSQQAQQLVPPNQPQLSYQSQRPHQLQASQQPQQRQVLHAALSFQARPAHGKKANASSPKKDIPQQSTQPRRPRRQLQHSSTAPTSPTNTDSTSISSSPATASLSTAAAIERRDDMSVPFSIAAPAPPTLVSTPAHDLTAGSVDTAVQGNLEMSLEGQVLEAQMPVPKDPVEQQPQHEHLEQHKYLGPVRYELEQDQGTETETDDPEQHQETDTDDPEEHQETDTDDPEQNQETDTDDPEQHQEMEVDELEQDLEVEIDELQHDQETVPVEQQQRQQQQEQGQGQRQGRKGPLPQRQQGEKRRWIIQNDDRDEDELMGLDQPHTTAAATTAAATRTSTPASTMQQSSQALPRLQQGIMIEKKPRHEPELKRELELEQDNLVERRRGSSSENWRQPGRWYLSSVEIPTVKRTSSSREPTPVGYTSRPRSYSTRSSASASPSPSNGSNAVTGNSNGSSSTTSRTIVVAATASKKDSSHTKITSRPSPSPHPLAHEKQSSANAPVIPSTTTRRLRGRSSGRGSSTSSTRRSRGRRQNFGTVAVVFKAKADDEQRDREDADKTDDDNVKTKGDNGETEEDKDETEDDKERTEDEQTEDERTEDEQTEDDDERTEDDDEQTDDEVSGSGSAPAPGLFSFSPSDAGTGRLNDTRRLPPRIGVLPTALQKGARHMMRDKKNDIV